MRSRWFHRPLLHSPALGLEKKATWLELFYDLIFVAAFIQLGNGLSENVSLRGAAIFAGMFVPLWVAWTGFTFYENRFTVDDFLHRTVVLVQMFAVGGMAISAPAVFEGRLFEFGLASGIAQCMVAVMYLRAHAQVPEAKAYSRYWGSVFGGCGAAFLVSTLLPLWPATLLCLAGTLGVLLSPLSPQSRALSERFPIDFHHLGERYGLLTIIVLGESFVKVLSAIASEQAGLHLYMSGGVVLLLTCGLWWVYFDDVAGSHIRKGHAQWIIWLYAHIPLQIGITAVGVAVKKALHFSWGEPLPDKYRWLLAGSLAVAYLAVAAIDSVAERKQAELSDRSRINARASSALFLLVLAPAGGAMSGGGFLMLVTAVVVAQVIFDMMMAPFESSEHAELGTRTTAEVARARLAVGQRASKARNVGEAVRKGAPSELRQDLYFYLIDGSWWRVATVFTFIFVILNAFFAALYVLQPGSIQSARPDSFIDAFFFSVQTMSTIGYGTLSPGSDWGNAIVTVEAVVGMVGAAVVTGLVFAKLSRPSAGVAFSKPLVVTRMHGQDVLTFRAGNTRGNEVVDASMTLTVLMDELTPEGQHLRRLRDLKLVRRTTPMFRLTWSVMHVIDEDSPLYGTDWNEPDACIISLIATFVGHDGTYGQTTHARHIYDCDDLRIGHRFVDIIHELPDGRTMIDYEHFGATVPEEAPGGAAGGAASDGAGTDA